MESTTGKLQKFVVRRTRREIRRPEAATEAQLGARTKEKDPEVLLWRASDREREREWGGNAAFPVPVLNLRQFLLHARGKITRTVSRAARPILIAGTGSCRYDFSRRLKSIRCRFTSPGKSRRRWIIRLTRCCEIVSRYKLEGPVYQLRIHD